MYNLSNIFKRIGVIDMGQQIGTRIVSVMNGSVHICKDLDSGTYSIGVTTNSDYAWKPISEELYNLLKKELEYAKSYK